MKDNIMQRISAVLSALNTVSVSGKQNLGNLAGSIAALEELYGILGNCEINTNVQQRETHDIKE